MNDDIFAKEIQINDDTRIYFGNIHDIFLKTTGEELQQNYAVMGPCRMSQEKLENWFSSDEIGKILGFKSLKKQAEWIAGRYLVKNSVIVMYPDLNSPEIEVQYKSEGAPYIFKFPEIPFSLSHSGKYSVIIISKNLKSMAAVDMEEIIPKNINSIAKVAFTENERMQFSQINNADYAVHDMLHLSKFYEIWTGKEAYLKFIGRGFHEPLKNIEIIGSCVFHNGIIQNLNLFSFVFDNHFVSYIVV